MTLRQRLARWILPRQFAESIERDEGAEADRLAEAETLRRDADAALARLRRLERRGNVRGSDAPYR